MPSNTLQSLGGLPTILIILAGVALFLVLRLRSVLGKRVGFERPPQQTPVQSAFNQGPVIEAQALPPQQGHAVPDPHSPLGQRLMQIVNRVPDFDPPKFLEQAESLFRTIVTAFAAGDRATLYPLLSEHVFQTFDSAIQSRETAGEKHRMEIKSIRAATIEDAQLLGDQAAIIVHFVSDQVNLSQDASGNTLTGSGEETEISDLWTFERNLKSPGQAWRLAAARSGN